jgi:hypothetical protein
MLLFPASEIRLAGPANPLTPGMHFYAVGGPTQHKFILPSKTNLSPALETLENAADAVDRMQETKDVQKSATDSSCFPLKVKQPTTPADGVGCSCAAGQTSSKVQFRLCNPIRISLLSLEAV